MRAGAAIFVQMGAAIFSEMCVRVSTCTPLRCGCAPQVHTLSFFVKKTYFSVITKKCAGAGAVAGAKNGGCKKWCAGACAADYDFCAISVCRCRPKGLSPFPTPAGPNTTCKVHPYDKNKTIALSMESLLL